MKDMTAVPPPAVPPATVESQVSRRVSMDTTGVVFSPTQDQDPQSAFSRISLSRWTRQVLVPPSPKFRTAHRFLCRSLSLAKNTSQPSWETLPHSFRCSFHQCSRS